MTALYPKWSAEELAILERNWKAGGAIRLWEDQLPGRSARSIEQQGKRMAELHGWVRGPVRVIGASVSWALMKAEMERSGPISAPELSKRTGVSLQAVYENLKVHRNEVHKPTHEKHRYCGGYAPALWALGPGPDAVRKKAPPRRQRLRVMERERPDVLAAAEARTRFRKAERAGKFKRADPAAAWLNQDTQHDAEPLRPEHYRADPQGEAPSPGRRDAGVQDAWRGVLRLGSDRDGQRRDAPRRP
ncbi:hypothetical protein [Cupriavidus sp. Marseille-Q8015]